MSAKTTEERLADLERALVRLERVVHAGRPTPPGVVPPMGLLCKHCKEPLSNGEPHGRGHCVISDAEDPPDVAREQREAWEAKPPEDKDPAAMLGEAVKMAYRAEALAFEVFHSPSGPAAAEDVRSARVLLSESVAALRRAKTKVEASE